MDEKEAVIVSGTAPSEVPMAVPTIGRMVIVRDDMGQDWPAIVYHVQDKGEEGILVDVNGFTNNGAEVWEDLIDDPDAEIPWSWRWPPRA